jgi:hypothetical protein
MSQQQFIANVSASLYSANDQSAVYTTWDPVTQSYMFYYFSNGRLNQMDHGQPQQIRVQHEILNR